MLTFEPVEHIYQWDGLPVPSVTQILNQWIRPSGSPYYVDTFSGATILAETFEAARDAGSAIHKGAAYILTGQGLDWDALSPELVAPLRQLEEWVRLFKVEPLYVEEPMFSTVLGVAGTPDILCRINGDKHAVALVDIKTGAYGLVAPQLYAYETIFREFHKCRKLIKRYVLHLPKNGGIYQFKPVEDNYAWPFFLARLSQWRYLKSKG